jgi:hypothetical protein
MARETCPQADAPSLFDFGPLDRRRVQVVFDEPELSSDAGAVILREAAEANGIIDAMVTAIRDDRDQAYVRHTLRELLLQRSMQICHGYEDANDCDTMRHDAALKLAAGRGPEDGPLASQPTMTRLENSVSLRDLIRLFYVFIDNFLDSFQTAPRSIVIDMDPTANPTYGEQQLSLFNFHYDGYCLMPFHVYDGITGRLIATVIRPGKTPTDREILALLRRIVRRISKRFPKTVLFFRADSHHTKPAVMDWMEAHGIHYCTGLQINAVLKREVADLVEDVRLRHQKTMQRCRRFHSFEYQAASWSRPRRVVARIEATANGTDTRFIVTDLQSARARFLYEDFYCDRGNAELMIKEHKCFLKSSRSSCTSASANQFRMYVHSAAYVIMHGLRDTLLRGTSLASATFDRIRLRLLKVAARVEARKTYVRFHLPASCPTAPIYQRCSVLAAALNSS